jgi:toxin ParE1/3/4
VKRVAVRPAAAADIEDAYQWYEAQQPGLGEEFLMALNVTRDQIVEHPEAFPILHRNTRRALIPRRFPYGVFYRIDDEMAVGADERSDVPERRAVTFRVARAGTVLFSVGAGRSEAGHGHIAGCWRVVRHRYL